MREIKTSLMLRDISDTVCPVADKELVEETPCEPDKPEDDCEEVNQKFLERCRERNLSLSASRNSVSPGDNQFISSFCWVFWAHFVIFPSKLAPFIM